MPVPLPGTDKDRIARREPQPQTEQERVALLRWCPTCWANEGSWCCTSAARDDYVARLHVRRLTEGTTEK